MGRTFDPGARDRAEASNVEGLTQAILETLDLSSLPDTAAHCRAAAMRFSWSVLGPVYEDLYRRVLSRGNSIPHGADRKTARG
ncbi:MAG: hypothetical protein M3Y07_02440 [Acidobacteriota bacterium]|nr:hypothetical protein [Acidobacteriota bacterium]